MGNSEINSRLMSSLTTSVATLSLFSLVRYFVRRLTLILLSILVSVTEVGKPTDWSHSILKMLEKVNVILSRWNPIPIFVGELVTRQPYYITYSVPIVLLYPFRGLRRSG